MAVLKNLTHKCSWKIVGINTNLVFTKDNNNIILRLLNSKTLPVLMPLQLIIAS